MADENQEVLAKPEPTTPAPEVEKDEIDDSIKLSPAQYSALLDHIDTLEEMAKAASKAPSPSRASAEDLRREAKEGGPRPENRIDLDALTPAQLANVILNEVAANIAQPLLVKMETLRLNQEIKEITGGKKDHEFFQYKDDIYEIASKNPNMSIDEAYTLARAKRPLPAKEEGEKSSEKRDTNRDVLRTLPPRRPYGGERSGPSRAATDSGDPESRMDAGRMALEDLRKAGKL
jgi:hypothetical protein